VASAVPSSVSAGLKSSAPLARTGEGLLLRGSVWLGGGVVAAFPVGHVGPNVSALFHNTTRTSSCVRTTSGRNMHSEVGSDNGNYGPTFRADRGD
jgi:hypothetical protein